MITVIAGVNGAGKSSIAGSAIRKDSGDYFNPDEVAKELLESSEGMTQESANSEAWQIGLKKLKQAIDEDAPYTFETTLGGTTICQTLHDAIENGRKVQIFYIGLNSPELHIERVSQRVERGGHSIPEEKIRERWNSSIRNLIGLIPNCHRVRVIDNSAPINGNKPHPVTLFEICDGQLIQPPTEDIPEWAKSLASAALRTTNS